MPGQYKIILTTNISVRHYLIFNKYMHISKLITIFVYTIYQINWLKIKGNATTICYVNWKFAEALFLSKIKSDDCK